MSLTGGIIIYATLWFLTLFIVVMVGQRSQQDAGEVVPGTPAGAPADLQVRPTVIKTTAIATLLWAVLAAVIFSGLITRADVMGFDQLFR